LLFKTQRKTRKGTNKVNCYGAKNNSDLINGENILKRTFLAQIEKVKQFKEAPLDLIKIFGLLNSQTFKNQWRQQRKHFENERSSI